MAYEYGAKEPEKIKIKDMIRYGFILNIIGIVLISAAAQLLYI